MSARCQEFTGWFEGSEQEALSAAERARLDQHLAQCPACVATLKGTVVQKEVLRSVYDDAKPAPPLAPDLVRRIVEAMGRAAGEGRPGKGARTG